jgi:hypothetical protein
MRPGWMRKNYQKEDPPWDQAGPTIMLLYVHNNVHPFLYFAGRVSMLGLFVLITGGYSKRII